MNSVKVDTVTSYDEKQKIWTGRNVKPLYGPDMSIGKLALQIFLKDPDHIAQICYQSGLKLTNKEMAVLSIRVAQNLKKYNLKQGDVIGIDASNSDYLAPLVFGLMYSGLIISTLDPSFDKDGIKHTFSLTKPVLMFCDGSIYDTVRDALTDIQLNIPILTMIDRRDGVPHINELLKSTGEEDNFQPVELKHGPNQTAAILCSSGTTGLPKGVCMSNIALINGPSFEMESTDTYLTFSTLYWISGLYGLLQPTFMGATRLISEKPFNADDFLNMIEKCRVTYTLTPPSQMALTLKSPKIKAHDLSSLKIYLCGGSAVAPALVDKMKKFIPNCTFVIGYGMSEVCGVCTYGIAESNGNVGKLAKNMKLVIIDSYGNRLGPNEHGEICIRPSFPWAGYYSNPEATKAIYENGWVHSGDLGYVDDEGNVFVIDRIKDILKYNNFHFFPTEIESFILKLPGVNEVCVCGIPDEVSSFLPAAAIVKTPNSDLKETDVINYVADHMTHFKHLRGGVYFLDELPKTISGKSLRRTVSDICEKLRKERFLSK